MVKPVIEITANLLLAGLAIYFMNTVLEQGEKTTKWKIVLFWLLYFAVVTFLTYPSGFEGLGAIVYGGILFVYACLALNGKVLEKFVYAMLWNVIILISSSAIFYVSKYLINRNMSDVYDVEAPIRVIELLSTFLLRLLLIKVIKMVKERKRKEGKNNTKFTVIVILFCIITWGNLVGMFFAEINIGQNDRYLWIILLLVELSVCMIALFYLYERWNRIEQEKLKNDYLEAMNAEQEKYILELVSTNEAIRILRHDIKKYLYILYTSLCNEQYEECKRYLETFKGKNEEALIGEPDSLHIILKNRKTICEKECITFHYNALGNWKKIDIMDLCVLIWNLLDNAIEAEKKEEEKEIQLEISNYKGYLKIECKNRIHKSVLNDNPNLITNKKDKSNHGLGLISVKKMVEKYDGMQKITEENGYFVNRVFLQNN